MQKSIKTSEFYVVVFVLLTWALRYVGFDVEPQQVANSAVDIAKQLHEISGSDNSGILLAGIYAAARTAMKWKQIEKGE